MAYENDVRDAAERDGLTEVESYFSQLSNWGRWGSDDALGTLNLVGPEQRRAALAEIKHGRTISCGHVIAADTMAANPGNVMRFMVESGEGAPGKGWGSSGEWVGLRFHGRNITHIDALGHIFWDGKAYNGKPAAGVTVEDGATWGSIESLPGGHLLARGLLLDLPRSQGKEFLPQGPPGAGVDEILACERHQGTPMESGDAVFIRTGRTRAAELNGGPVPGGRISGLAPQCLPLLRERDIALLGGDGVNDPRPNPETGAEVHMPIHAVGISAMGLWLIDNVNMEELAATCAELGRWRFCLVVSALRVSGATGSPVNPVAIV
jgi:kynurenine formamidase